MKKKYDGLWRAGQNIGASIMLTGAMLVLRVIQMLPEGITNAEIKMMISVFFSASLVFIAGLIFFVNLMNWYYITDAVKISMGYSRKGIFIDMQITKLVSASGVSAVILAAAGEGLKSKDMQWLFWSFGLLMLFQALGELVIQVWFRFRKMGVILLTAASAVFGFWVAYGTLKFMKNGVLIVNPDFEMLIKNPVAGAVLLFLIYHILVFLSWNLWKKAEITL